MAVGWSPTISGSAPHCRPSSGYAITGAHITACTHLGRPKGTRDPAFDLAPVRSRLDELMPGVELLENLRFSPGEEANDPAFVLELVKDQDAYVNDAFGASHRAHASIVGPPAYLPSAAGRLLAREVEVLTGLLASPARPFVVVVGGAKVKDKIGVLRSLATKSGHGARSAAEWPSPSSKRWATRPELRWSMTAIWMLVSSS